jgi:hypothetical protein
MTWSDGPRPAMLAAGVPTAVYLATSAPSAHWLDSGTFVAQAADLGIAHPPGHPLAGLVHGAAMLLPIGPVAFRVALVSALCAGLATLFFYHAARSTYITVTGPEIATPLAIGSTWWLAGAFGFWFQAVRPEVYALQAALLAFVISQLIRFEEEWPPPKGRLLVAGAFVFGLALANHHLLALLLLPAAAATLGRWVRERGFRGLGLAATAGLAGVLTYVYLPLRAGSDAALRLGHPDSPSRFYWTVSAEAFQKNQGAGVPQPLGERFADVLVQLADSLHVALLVCALIGLYILLRLTKTRRVGVIWALILVIFLSARAWLGFVRNNPDALGYLIPAMMALVVMAGAFAATIVQMIVGARRQAPKWLVAIVVLLSLGGAGQFVRHAERASLAGFNDADLFDDLIRRDLPDRAIIIAHSPQTIFRYWGGEAEERLRPDVTLVPVPLLPYPGMVDDLVTEEPELRDLLRGVLMVGHVRLSDLQSLAGDRPVLLELDPRVDPALFGTLIPRGAYYEVVNANASDNDRREGAEDQSRRWQHLMERLDLRDGETRAQVFWRRFQDAVFYAQRGDRDFARGAIDDVLAINDEDEHARALATALQTPNAEGELEGPIDVQRFLLSPSTPED